MNLTTAFAQRVCFSLLTLALIMPAAALADDEISLYDSTGEPVAYIAPENQMTIYLWDGTPVAYLDPSFTVYGFNGENLGWVQNGVIIDHDGNVACATKEAITNPQIEPFKGFKAFIPFKSFERPAPPRPAPSNSWSTVSCALFLSAGQS